MTLPTPPEGYRWRACIDAEHITVELVYDIWEDIDDADGHSYTVSGGTEVVATQTARREHIGDDPDRIATKLANLAKAIHDRWTLSETLTITLGIEVTHR